jgi:SNF2 family DNA or RNA helicase
VIIEIKKQIIETSEKAIVFSQWTSMLDFLEVPLRKSCIQYRRLDGTMFVLAQDKAVNDFHKLLELTILIMSLQVESLGLNMVVACHVLLPDLWWNPTTKDQYIDRAHRIGKMHPIIVSRFIVKYMVASTFGEDGAGGRQTRLTEEDLRYLFMV